jgi:hypothetical protein
VARLLAAGAFLAACAPSSAAPSITPGSAALSCRLPVARHWVNGTQESAGFVAFPSGSFAKDPTSATGPFSGDVNDQAHPWRTQQSPVLYGDASALGSRLTFDPAFKRWLPVVRGQMLPDGSAYVYTMLSGAQSEVHRVVVGSASDTVILRLTDPLAGGLSPSRASYYRPEGIYLTGWSGEGLRLFDPATGAIRALSTEPSTKWIVEAGAAWSVQAHQGPEAGGTSPSGIVSLVRLDLNTGSTAVWFSIPSDVHPALGGIFTSPQMALLGFDETSHPLVEVPADLSNNPGQLWLVSGPNAATHLDGLAQPTNPPWYDPSAQFMTDPHGLWLGRSDGIYVYAKGRFTQEAAAPFGNQAYDIVGQCQN